MVRSTYLRLRRGIPDNERSSDVIRIHTGLSAIVCGHLVEVQRDLAHKVATVCVKVREGYRVTGLEWSELEDVASDVAARAQRFLGHDWTVVPWHPPDGTATTA